MEGHFSITNRTRSTLPRVHLREAKRLLLGPHYRLSLVCVGDTVSRALNRRYRGAHYTPNVLAFPLQKNDGEIFINPKKADREARVSGMSRRAYLVYLFIHGCLHLKGLRHGATMEHIERRVLRRLKLL